MAKKKKKLSEITDAILNNTSFIKQQKEETPVIEIQEVVPENAIEIEKAIFSKIRLLANYYEKKPEELINEAIAHFLRLKKLDIDEALKNIVVGDDDE